MGAAEAVWAAQQAVHELALFAAIGLLLGGLDDLLVDLIWAARSLWRRLTIYRWHERTDAGSLSAQANGPVAVFVPAWRESDVIAAMAATALSRWAREDVRLYVGCYPNDLDTIRAVRSIARHDRRLRLVVNPRGIM